MKQKLRNKLPKGILKTKYWIDKKHNKSDTWFVDAQILMDQIMEVVNYYEKIDIKLTNRQLYYQLVGKDYIPNFTEVYDRICTCITDLRYAGVIDWDTIEDVARVARKHIEFDDITDGINWLSYTYRRERWQDQEYYLEMYCEKEAGISTLKPVTMKYHIHFGYNKGYSSAAALYVLTQRISDQMGNNKKVVILYFGDHDASGLDMVRDIKKRVIEFLQGGVISRLQKYEFENEFYKSEVEKCGDYDCCGLYSEEWKPIFKNQWLPDKLKNREINFEIIPVSLTMEQIKKYNPPPNPAKMTDPRAAWYIEKFGKVSWELDAIDALELRKIAKKAILKYLDIDKYKKWIKLEKKEIEKLKKLAEENKDCG